MQLNSSVNYGRVKWVRANLMLAAMLASPILLEVPAYAIHFEPLPAEACKLQPMAEDDPPLKCGSRMVGNPATQSCFERGGSLLLGPLGNGFCWLQDNPLSPPDLTARRYSTAATQAIGTCLIGGRAARFTLRGFECVVIPRAVRELTRKTAVIPIVRP